MMYRSEHVIDLKTGAILSAEVQHGDRSDTATLHESLDRAQQHLHEVNHCKEIEEVVADKGYHSADALVRSHWWGCFGLRTYIAEPNRGRQKWSEKHPEDQQLTYANRRRLKGERSKKLHRKRGELLERSFAHLCDSGGGRKCWLRGLEANNKRYRIQAAAQNLSLVMRKLFGFGKPRELVGNLARLLTAFGCLLRLLFAPRTVLKRDVGFVLGKWRQENSPRTKNRKHSLVRLNPMLLT